MKMFNLFSDNLFCPYDGKRMEYPHDDWIQSTANSYDIYTGKKNKEPNRIRRKDLQYCIKHDIYLVKNEQGNWIKKHGLLEILHIIA